MSTSSINTPTPLVVGDTAAAVMIGSGGVITVDNTTLGAAGSITLSGTLVIGTLSSASLSLSTITSTTLADSGALQATSASPGALACSSIASAGDVTQPRYALRVVRTAALSITNNAVVTASFDGVDPNGGTSNWGAITFPATNFVCPKSGLWLVTIQLAYAAAAGGSLMGAWGSLNSNTVRYGESLSTSVAGAVTTITTTFWARVNAGTQFSAVAFQGSAGALNVLGDPTHTTYLHAERMTE